MPAYDNLKDKIFNNWTVKEYIGTQNRNAKWRCQCKCGRFSDVYAYNLKSGASKQCHYCSTTGSIIEMDISEAYFSYLKGGAKRRKIKLLVSKEDIWNQYIKQGKRCALSGLEIYFSKTNKEVTYGTASVDRIDSDKDYTIDNIQIVHKHINIMKNTFTQKYFIEMCKSIAKNNELGTPMESDFDKTVDVS